MNIVSIQKYSKEEGVFLLKNIERTIINGIRRILLSEIPSYTIDSIEMEKNNSLMNDEYLAHRIGLIPFLFRENEKNFRNTEDCSCIGGCKRCTIYLKLEKENNEKELMNVYSSDFLQEPNEYYKVEPISIEKYPKGILLCKLDKGESISLRGILKKGIGKEHAKWSCVSTVSFREIPILKIKEDELKEDTELIDKIISSCPVNIFQKEENKLHIKEEMNCIQCHQCSEISPSIEISYHPNEFELTIESNGIMNVKDLFKKSLSILKEKLNNLKN